MAVSSRFWRKTCASARSIRRNITEAKTRDSDHRECGDRHMLRALRGVALDKDEAERLDPDEEQHGQRETQPAEPPEI